MKTEAPPNPRTGDRIFHGALGCGLLTCGTLLLGCGVLGLYVLVRFVKWAWMG